MTTRSETDRGGYRRSRFLSMGALVALFPLACASGQSHAGAGGYDGRDPDGVERPRGGVHPGASDQAPVISGQAPPSTARHLRLCRDALSDFVEHPAGRAVLRVERGFLSPAQTTELAQRIERGLQDIEGFLGTNFDAAHYSEPRIVISLFEQRCISHVKGGYYQTAAPYVFMSLDEPRGASPRCPYLHEMVHIIAWDWSHLWIREGLAVFLNDELGGYPTYPNYGRDLDEAAAALDSSPEGQRAVALIATSDARVPKDVLADMDVRQAYYIHAGSFVRYLWKRLGRETFAQIYRSNDPADTLRQLGGASLAEIKADWVGSLPAHGPTSRCIRAR